MSVVVAMLGALGLLLIFDGATGARPERSRMAGRLERLARESGINGLTGPRLAALSASGSILIGLVVAGVTSSLVIGCSFAIAAGWLPLAYATSKRALRRSKLREAWPDAIASLVSAARSGISLPEACMVLSERGPEDLRTGFAAFASSYRATGSFRAALERLESVMADPVADRIGASLAVAHEVGGSDLVRVLRTLSDFVREDLRVRKEIEARWSWTVTAARVAAAAPWIVLLLMATRPEAANAYNSSTGVVVVSVGGVATVLGYRLMLRAGRLPEERRLR